MKMVSLEEMSIAIPNTREPRGFGFVQYIDPADAAEAKYEMDRQILHGRELTVVFAEENRKKPAEMRAKERTRSRSYDYRSPPRYSRSRYSRSPSPRYSRSRQYSRSRSHSPIYYSPPPGRRRNSRSRSPRDARYYYRGRSSSRSPSYRRSRSRSEGYAKNPSRRERSLSVSQ